MTEIIVPDNDHLEEETLHEYLDEALAAPAQAQIEAHLAVCTSCREEVETLRVLFIDLEALPDIVLTRDLSPTVLDAIDTYPISWQTGRWLVLVQVAIALVVLVFSWPLVVRQAAGLQLGDWSVLAQSWSVRTLETLAITTTTWSVQANIFLERAMALLREPLGISIAGFNIWPWVAAIGLCWLLVNGLILRPTSEGHPFKTSNGNT